MNIQAVSSEFAGKRLLGIGGTEGLGRAKLCPSAMRLLRAYRSREIEME